MLQLEYDLQGFAGDAGEALGMMFLSGSRGIWSDLRHSSKSIGTRLVVRQSSI